MGFLKLFGRNWASYMKNSEINISVDIGLGKANTTFWTCDFTNDYVSINTDYRS